MYLKSLELVGFKSFAEKTRLDFEPGMTAIVGPNGCGKSNVSDGIRWVLGETSPKALRGSKMEDCIFNGTDTHKPLGMAEVSLTLADCESALGTDYHEVTVTRRVFRSGEGQYFMNKTLCRLKDIQRLFMDTGIGTSSYSFMEQGRIDRILSSHPEDRREVFEEASGITKFKADKEEAIRKLEHTETNLLRLADVIREVKRQIGSLQRQAGKARSYKAFKEELRKVDIFATKQRMQIVDSNIAKIEADITGLNGKLRDAHSEVEELQNGSSVLRESLMQTEREIGSVAEAGSQAKHKLEQARELIRSNRQRIEEYREFSERDSKEISRTNEQIAEKKQILKDLSARTDKARLEQAAAEKELKISSDAFARQQQQIETSRSQIQGFREESFQLESTASKLQNQLAEIEIKERHSTIERERLSAEKSRLSREATAYEKRTADMGQTLAEMKKELANCEGALRDLESRKTATVGKMSALQQASAGLQSQSAGKHAQIDMIADEESSNEVLPGGARLLLDPSNPLGVNKDAILGNLASHLDVEPGYEVAVEAALRSWLDAVLVADSRSAIEMIRRLESRRAGPARIVTADAPASLTGNGSLLLNHVKCSEHAASAVRALIGNVYVVDDCEAIPSPVPEGAAYVTKKGALVGGRGCMEFWMSDAGSANPLSRKHVLAEAKRSLASIEQELAANSAALKTLLAESDATDQAVIAARSEAQKHVRAMAQKEGEAQVVSGEASEARQRLETVTFELETINSQGKTGDKEKETTARRIEEIRAQRERLAADTNRLTHELQQIEGKHSELNTEVTNHRVRFSELSQRVEHLTMQSNSVETGISDLVMLAENRSKGVHTYESGIKKLTDEIKDAEGRLVSLEEDVASSGAKIESMRKNREKQAKELAAMETMLTQKRTSLDEIRQAKSDLDVRHAETRMRRQNMIDRLYQEYGLTLEQFTAEPEPQWEGETPTLEANETRVAELKTKIDAMGPVNTGADEEFKELEERYAFLTTQEADLVNAKQQLMEMIKKINLTTTELFKSTFDRINVNFQAMFEKLFNGGSAKLVLVNEEDVLDCGIEIIARPPGKRLQNVSLLSGGERTLTAVALLFAIYMIKPSPFCLLDELDAALDEANIGRFVVSLQEFLKQSQFVVITHNRNTIAAANVLYGVTMPEKGISKTVSMKFKSREEKDAAVAQVADK